MKVILIDSSVAYLQKFISTMQKQIFEIDVNKENVDISLILDQSIKSYIDIINSQNINIIKNYHRDHFINCDPLKIEEVFKNIIRNSIEAINNQNGIIEIAIKSKTISIRDNGSGISKENLPRIIDPFFSTKTNLSNNFGLGLTYCYNIIKAHSASMDIFSDENKGTTILINFEE